MTEYKSIDGILSYVGTQIRGIFHRISGALSSAAVCRKKSLIGKSGDLSFSSVCSAKCLKKISGDLSFSAFCGIQGVSGNLSFSSVCETTYILGRIASRQIDIAGYSTADWIIPGQTDFAAIGGFTLVSDATYTPGPAEVFVASGSLDVCGVSREDTIIPGEAGQFAFTASGSFSFSGRSAYTKTTVAEVTPYSFVSTGEMRFGDPLPFLVQCVYPPDEAEAASRALAAKGGVDLYGSCLLGTVSAEEAEAAKAYLGLGGFSVSGQCVQAVYTLGPLVSPFTARGGFDFSGASARGGAVPGEVGGVEVTPLAAKGGLDISGTSLLAGTGVVGGVAPTETAVAARGGFAVSGICVHSEVAAGPLASNYAARGQFEVSGISAYIATSAGAAASVAFTAKSGFDISGTCVQSEVGAVSILVSSYAAKGGVEISGSCLRDTTTPPVVIVVPAAYIAKGSLEISGISVQGEITEGPQVSSFLAKGSLEISGIAVRDTTTPPVIIVVPAAYLAKGGMEISGTSAQSEITEGPQVSSFAAKGALEISGISVRDTTTPPVVVVVPAAYLAKGGVEISGTCIQSEEAVSPLVFAYLAKGGVEISGFAVRGGTAPGVSSISAFAAQGGLKIVGYCTQTTVLPGEAEAVTASYAARGGLAFYGDCLKASVLPEELEADAYASWGSLEITGDCSLIIPAAAPVYAFASTSPLGTTLLISGDSTAVLLLPPSASLAAMGGYIIETGEWVPPDDSQDIFDAWVLSGQAFEPSMFSNFKFNSFSTFQDVTYAAGEDGIYILEGADDDGTAIHPGVRLGVLNFGSDREKRLRGIQFGSAGDDVKVRVVAENGEDIFTSLRDDNRIVVSRNLQGREWTIEIADFDELNQLEITPLLLARR